jgi:hypothetical protein
MSLDGAVLILSDMHFGRDILSPPELPFTSVPGVVKAIRADAPLLKFFEEKCLGHNLNCVRSLPRYLQYVLDVARDEGFKGYDFDRYVLLGDQVTIPDKQSYRFVREYLTEPEYKSNATGFEKLILTGLRIEPSRIIAIPGNHDKLLRKDLAIYDAEFTDQLSLPKIEKQRCTIVSVPIPNRDILFILVDANRYAAQDGALDLTFRNHLACGYVTEELEADVFDKLDLLRRTGSAEGASLRDKFEKATKILAVHFAVDLKQVLGIPNVEGSVVPHLCEGLDRLVESVHDRFGLDLVIHGHLHTPGLYEYDRVPVLAATTTTQEGGKNGFHILKFFETGEIRVEFHSWNGVAFARDPTASLTKTLNPDYSHHTA